MTPGGVRPAKTSLNQSTRAPEHVGRCLPGLGAFPRLRQVLEVLPLVADASVLSHDIQPHLRSARGMLTPGCGSGRMRELIGTVTPWLSFVFKRRSSCSDKLSLAFSSLVQRPWIPAQR